MKKQILGLSSLVFLLAVSLGVSAAWAQPAGRPGPGPGDCPGSGRMVDSDWYAKLSPEKQQAWDTSWRDHQAVMQPLRDQMWRKNMEYRALSGNSNLKSEDIQGLLDEMSDLRTKMRAEGEKFHDKMVKDGFDQGIMGPRGGGYGHGYGSGDGYHKKGSWNHQNKSHRGQGFHNS